MTTNKLFAILENDHQHSDEVVIAAIDELYLQHYDSFKDKDKSRFSKCLLSIKWSENKEKHNLPYESLYTVGNPPYAGIYADVIMWQGFWEAQKMFGKAKTPYWLDENGEKPA